MLARHATPRSGPTGTSAPRDAPADLCPGPALCRPERHTSTPLSVLDHGEYAVRGGQAIHACISERSRPRRLTSQRPPGQDGMTSMQAFEPEPRHHGAGQSCDQPMARISESRGGSAGPATSSLPSGCVPGAFGKPPEGRGSSTPGSSCLTRHPRHWTEAARNGGREAFGEAAACPNLKSCPCRARDRGGARRHGPSRPDVLRAES